MPLDVICPDGCGEILLETNDSDGYLDPEDNILFRDFKSHRKNESIQKFNPDAEVHNAAMVRFKKNDGYLYDFPHDASLTFDALLCPECGQSLCPSGRLTTRPQKVIVDVSPMQGLFNEAIDSTLLNYNGIECRYCGEHFPTSKGRIIHEKRWCSKRPQAE